MIMKTFASRLTQVSLGALISLPYLVATNGLQAGERVIFSNSHTPIEVPKEVLESANINPNAQGFDKSSSSVEGVTAPWQNPLSRSTNSRTKRRLLKELDRQKNWMLQDPEELLESRRSTDDSDEIDLDDIEFSSKSRSFRSYSRSKYQLYSERESRKSRFDPKAARNRARANYARKVAQQEKENQNKSKSKDAYVTRQHFDPNFKSVFDAPKRVETNTNNKPKNETPKELASNNASTELRLEDTANTLAAFNTNAKEPTTFETRANEFDKLLNTTIMDMTTSASAASSTGPANTGFGASILGSSAGPAGARSPITSAMQPSIMENMRSTISSSMGAGAAASSPAFGGGLTSGGIFGNNAPAPTIRNRPTVFDLPQRSF